MNPTQDTLLFAILATVFTILFLLELRSVLKIAPYLGKCVWRWKYNLEIEDSLQLSRSRNQVALTLVVPLCMLAYSWSLFSPEIIKVLPPTVQLCIVIAFLLFQMPLRAFLNWQIESRHHGTKALTAANGSFYSFLVILFFLLFVTGAAAQAITSDPESTRRILLWVTGLSYSLYVIRKGQIFASVCNPFVTILYLCGLELFPASLLVLVSVLL